MYVPHVQAIQAGQEILIKNSDATLHNIHGMPKINPEFNFAMPKVVKEKTIKIEKAENSMYIKCDVHPWMKAYISIFDHPYFSVTDDSGRYQIENVPIGTYEVVAWHERDVKRKGYTQTQSVKIGASETHSYTVEIDDEQFLQLAKKAAKHNITFNQMVNVTLLKNLKDDDYQFEHTPQLLNED